MKAGRFDTPSRAAQKRTRLALIVDDEPDLRELVVRTLARMNVDCHGAANLDEARHLLAHYRFDLCLTDLRLPDGNGVDFVDEAQRSFPDMPIAVVTAHGQMDVAVRAMKSGAFDFVSKPLDIERLRALVYQALSLDTAGPHETDASARVDEADDWQSARIDRRGCSPSVGTGLEPSSDVSVWPTPNTERAPRLVGGERLLGNSATMEQLRRLIGKVARTNVPVWLTGESGTGKEVIARLIHLNSARADRAFVPINCGAIPAELMESEFFGHRKGSFSGAHADRVGLFQSANGGTLFLDEIAELPLHMQVKLLRAVQERSIRAVGDSDETPVDVRILSATHQDLADAVDAGQFRHDLYYRLNVIAIRAPALRERPEDIAGLSDAILQRIACDSAAPQPHRLSLEARRLLESHTFPGNVRELENLLERAVALSESHTIDGTDLCLQEAAATPRTLTGELRATTSGAYVTPRPERLDAEPADPETARLLATLEAHRWNRRAAADALGLTYRQLRYRIERLDPPSSD